MRKRTRTLLISVATLTVGMMVIAPSAQADQFDLASRAGSFPQLASRTRWRPK